MGSALDNESLVIVLAVITNILSVVGVVICNKYIIEIDGFNFSVFLSFLHFGFTTMSMKVLLSFNQFQYTPAALSGVLPVSLFSLLSVGFMNLNLANNSVGFYQVMIDSSYTLSFSFNFFLCRFLSWLVFLSFWPYNMGFTHNLFLSRYC